MTGRERQRERGEREREKERERWRERERQREGEGGERGGERERGVRERTGGGCARCFLTLYTTDIVFRHHCQC